MTRTMTRRVVCFAALSLALAASAAPAVAQSYPNRPITLIIHSAAGGAIDLFNRVVAEKVSARLGQPIVLEFRPGGGATIGATAVWNARPDGYTIGFLGASVVAGQGLGKVVAYDVREFVPMGQIMDLRVSLSVANALPAKSVAELIALAKAEPGKLNYASTGFGSATHIAAELFMNATGIKMTHVPYQSGAVAMQDLVAGRIQVFFEGSSTAIPLVQSGQIRMLAITGSNRSPSVPDVATFQELGYEAARYHSWGGWVMPPKSPPDMAHKISEALLEAAKDEAIRKRVAEVGLELTSLTPARQSEMINSELVKYQNLAKSAGVKLD